MANTQLKKGFSEPVPKENDRGKGEVRIPDSYVEKMTVQDMITEFPKLVRGGQYRLKSLLRQVSVAYFSTTGEADASNLARTERREVVVQHELFTVFLRQAINDLLIPPGSQRRNAKGLCFSAGKEG